MSRDVALVAPGTVTVREWRKEPVRVPLREAQAYDRFAAELQQALGAEVSVVEAVDADAGVLLLPALYADGLPDELLERTLLLEASPSDHVQVVRRRLLGAIAEDALAAWRRGENLREGQLFARADVAARMSGPVSLMGEKFGYTVVDDDGGRGLPEVTADYLRAWRGR